MKTETVSPFIGLDQTRRTKDGKRLGLTLSLKHIVLIFWILVFCLLLVYLANSPLFLLKVTSFFRVPPASLSGAIPGLTYKNLSKHLRGTSVTCQPAVQTENGFTGVCGGLSPQGIVDIQIQVFGKTSDEIDTLQMDMVQYLRTPSKELFVGALGEVAAVPFKGYKPNAARAWVEKNLDVDEAVESFGGVRYQLLSYGPSMKRMFIGVPR